MKKLLSVFVVVMMVLVGLTFVGCTDAMVVSSNISQEADQFQIFRRVVFYNGITDKYILVVEGYSSIKVDTLDNQLELTVKTDDGDYLGLADNLTYFAEQMEPSVVSAKRYRVVFKPSVIVPDIELQ